MALRHYGTMALWHYDTMALWHYGIMTLCHYETTTPVGTSGYQEYQEDQDQITGAAYISDVVDYFVERIT